MQPDNYLCMVASVPYLNVMGLQYYIPELYGDDEVSCNCIKLCLNENI